MFLGDGFPNPDWQSWQVFIETVEHAGIVEKFQNIIDISEI